MTGNPTIDALMRLVEFSGGGGATVPSAPEFNAPAAPARSRGIFRSRPRMATNMGSAHEPSMPMPQAAPPMPAPAPPPQIGAGNGFDMAMMSPVPDPRRLTQPLPSMPPVGSPERPGPQIRLEDILQMPPPDIMPLPEPAPWQTTGPHPGMAGLVGPGQRGNFMRSDTLGRQPITAGDDIQQLLSSPEFEQTGTFDFGGPEGASQMFNRVQPQGNLLRDQLENDFILNDRRSGYAGAEGQRARDAKAAAQAGLLGLDRNRIDEKRADTGVELQNLRADLARELDASKTGRANKQEARLNRGQEFKMTEAEWRRAFNVAKFDQTERDALGKLLNDQRQSLATIMAEAPDDAAFNRAMNEMQALRARQKELSETPLEAPNGADGGAAGAAGGGEATEAEVSKIAAELPDTLSREEAIAEIEKRLGKKIPKSLRGE